MKKIVKAEILWSRKCALSCSYCGMIDNRDNSVSLDDWKKGIDALKKLECGFIAFYGAEPLMEFEKLPDIIQYAENMGIYTTVITSGIVSNFIDKLKKLHDYGTKSLTMSYDMIPLDINSARKMKNVIDSLLYFKNLGNIRDVAAVATLSKVNFRVLPMMIKTMTEMGIWTFFDIIHPARGQEGTKCKSYIGLDSLLFTKNELNELVDILKEVQTMKHKGYLIHSSDLFLEKLITNPDLIFKYNWNCADEDNFPAWLTIDVDGIVYPCDDYQPKSSLQIQCRDIYERWDEFSSYWKKNVIENCPGCLWNTHIDAHAIKRGQLSFVDYIHVKK